MPSSKTRSRLGIVLMVLLPIYIFALLSGDFWFHLMSNDKCYTYLGCNAGFFGYDALVHFLSGIIIAVSLLLIRHYYPEAAAFSHKKWMQALVIMGIAALIGVVWEILEFSYDHFRMDILHINLIYPNLLAQPSNSDTMGDLTFGLLGVLITLSILYLYDLIKNRRLVSGS